MTVPTQMSPELPSRALLRTLALALGFAPDSEDSTESSYINYILAHWPGKGTVDDYVRLFIDVVEHFRGDNSSDTKGFVFRRTKSKPESIKSYIDRLVAESTHPYFLDNPISSNVREIAVMDTVLLILGIWTLMQTYFVPQRGGHRRILIAYCRHQNKEYSTSDALGETLPGLLGGSGLLPSPAENSPVNEERLQPGEARELELMSGSDSPFALHSTLDSVESLYIETTALNAFKLANLGGVRILWTNNISRHLLLSKHAQKHYLELFAIPCALQGGAERVFRDIGISGDLMDEILASYSNLFNPRKCSFLHRYAGSLVGLRFWCWCLYCSSRRMRDREIKKLGARPSRSNMEAEVRLRDSTYPRYDPALKSLMEADPSWWDQTEFENLWPRLVALDAHLATAKPWNFWVIFRDRRDTVQFWTFLFGTIILVLTIVQVLLGAAQVAGSF